MQLFRSARWLMPALLLSALPSFSHAEVFQGVESALHMLPVLGQAATPADAAPTAQPQAPEKPIANRKHLDVSVGPLRMHLPVSGKRAASIAPANGAGNGPQSAEADIKKPITFREGNLGGDAGPTGQAPGVRGRIDPAVEESRGAQPLQTRSQSGGSPSTSRIVGQVTTDGAGAHNQSGGSPSTSIVGVIRDSGSAEPRTEIQAKPAAPGQAGKASAGQGRIDPAVTVVNNGAPGSPSNIEAAHIEQPITFRWTPVLPNPQDPVTYRVTVWQLMQGQTGTQAIKVNQPILTKLVDEPNLAFRPDAVTGPCQSPHPCDYVWNVQALDRMGRPIKGYNDSQQVAAFQYDAQSGAFTVQQPNSPIINNAAGPDQVRGKAGKSVISYDADAPGLKKPKKSTGQNQKQYILGVNMSFLMVAPPKGGGNQPGGAQPMATPGPSARGTQFNQDPGVAPSQEQIDAELGKLKQNPKYIQNRGTPQDGGNPPEHEQGRKILNQQPVGSLSQTLSRSAGTAVPQTPGTTGSDPQQRRKHTGKVIGSDDVVNTEPAGTPMKAITPYLTSVSNPDARQLQTPGGAPANPQPPAGMIFDRWGNLVRDAGPEQPRMNTGVAPTQTRTKKIPAGGGAPVTLGSGFSVPASGMQAAPQTRVGPCPPHVICRGDTVQSERARPMLYDSPGNDAAPTQLSTQKIPGGHRTPVIQRPGATTGIRTSTLPPGEYERTLPAGSPANPPGPPTNKYADDYQALKDQPLAAGQGRAIGASANGQSANATKNAVNPTRNAPQPAGYPITGVNISLPANPDARQLQTPGGGPANPQPQGLAGVHVITTDGTDTARMGTTTGGSAPHAAPAPDAKAVVVGDSTDAERTRGKAGKSTMSYDAVVPQPAQPKAITGPTNNPPGPPTITVISGSTSGNVGNKYANDWQANKDRPLATGQGRAIGASANGQSANGSRSAVNPNPAAPAPRQNKATQPGQLARTAAPRVASQPQPRRK